MFNDLRERGRKRGKEMEERREGWREGERKREKKKNFPTKLLLLNSLGQSQVGHKDVYLQNKVFNRLMDMKK